ncbi:MAG TPA: M23 family metallopeptidase [Cellvibrio sp.]|nr:M23 family metallopeptidase [Cellvibrio sp.]
MFRFFTFVGLYAIAACAVAVEFSGEWQQGAVMVGRVDSGEQVEFQGRKLKISSDGQFVLGLGRDAESPARLTIIQGGKRESLSFAVKKREYNIQRVEGVPQQTVEPAPEQAARIKREAELVAAARKNDSSFSYFSEKFQWPVRGPISGVYGSQRVYNGVPKAPHYGVDIARPTGTLVVAPAGGVVTLAHPDMFLSGGTLIVDHGQGLYSTFIHLSKILVKVGDRIAQGQKIGLVGQTGRASGPHLHWAMNWFETRVDPQLLVPPMAD